MSKLHIRSFSLSSCSSILLVSMLFTSFASFSEKRTNGTSSSSANTAEEWMTIIVHGTLGLKANLSYKTILAAQADCIEGTDYERNVHALRENPYLYALQPMQKKGLRKVTNSDSMLNASYVFSLLYTEVQQACGIYEKNEFYTFGWSGLISAKRRFSAACSLFKKIREKLRAAKKRGKKLKIRLIGYSHGGSLLLNLADVAKRFPADTVVIEETILVGLPVNLAAHHQVLSPIFKKVYNIYSRGDKVQRLDAFSQCDFFSSRIFKGNFPCLTQIEMKFTAYFRRNPCYCLPPRMQGMHNQSPGHIELWFFGWAPSSYRQNLNMYPLPGSVFIPYLICAANKMSCKNVIVDIRPDQEILRVQSKIGYERMTLPFMCPDTYQALLSHAMEYHPSNPKYKESFVRSQQSIDANAYK